LVVTRNLTEFNYDEVRNFIATATACNEYHIPSDHVDLKKEFLRVINTLYCYRFTMMNHGIASYHQTLVKEMSGHFVKEGTSTEIISNLPLLISLENKLMEFNPMKILELTEDTLKDKLQEVALFD